VEFCRACDKRAWGSRLRFATNLAKSNAQNGD
jgi:hypothetical protein